MGFFKNLFKSKYEKLTHEDINASIVKLEAYDSRILEQIKQKDVDIENMKAIAKAEKDPQMRLGYAKRVGRTRQRKKELLNNYVYVGENIALLERLRDTVDNNEMISEVTSDSVNRLLMNPKGLQNFLCKSLNLNQKAVQNITEGHRIFDDIQGVSADDPMYEETNDDTAMLAAWDKELGISDVELPMPEAKGVGLNDDSITGESEK